jgi:hypothetical protein
MVKKKSFFSPRENQMASYRLELASYGFEYPFFFVEADGFAQGALLQLHTQSIDGSIPLVDKQDWKCIQHGFHCSAGSETYVTFLFARIYGQLVCFYYPCSVKVDWGAIMRFLNVPSDRRCDATNFHRCIAACRQHKN